MVKQGMDCRNWNEDAYRNSILQHRDSLSRTIFRTVFAPNPHPNSNPGFVVTASSDGSIGSYSISSCLAYGCGNVRGQNWLVAEPHNLIQGHEGPAYDVKFYGRNEDSLLLSCGDDGRIAGWKWREVLECGTDLREGKLKPILDLVNPQHKGPWGALSPIPETNAIAVDSERGSIYTAAGDSCAYCWDMEKCQVKMVFKGHSNYLHSVAARNSCNQIITGSEDGTARIWDCNSGKCVQVIDPGKDAKLKESSSCISCIALDASESWLACGKGKTFSVWNLPTHESILRTSIHASLQDILFDDNQILAVGAQPLLTRFDMSGNILSQIHCAPQSIFSVSLHPTGVMAVSGYGALVDVISQFGSHLCTFRCRGL